MSPSSATIGVVGTGFWFLVSLNAQPPPPLLERLNYVGLSWTNGQPQSQYMNVPKQTIPLVGVVQEHI
jgi:hypothetical protein